MELFESYNRRINKINTVLNEYGIKNIEEAKKICDLRKIDIKKIINEIQPIAFENAHWAYTVGAAIAIQKNCKNAVEAAKIISRVNGFPYVQTEFDYFTGELIILNKIEYSTGERANINCYGADDGFYWNGE